MTDDIICPLCGKPNPPDLAECKYCQAPLKAGGFIAPSSSEDEFSQSFLSSNKVEETKNEAEVPSLPSNLEQAIPDWLKQTEASFLDQSETEPQEPTPDQISERIDSLLSPPTTPPSDQTSAIDDEWLASLLAEAGKGEPGQNSPAEEAKEEQAPGADQEKTEIAGEGLAEEYLLFPPEPVEKPDWVKYLESSSPIKFEGALPASETPEEENKPAEAAEGKPQEQPTLPDWSAKPIPEETPPVAKESDSSIAAAEFPGWLEAMRPPEKVSPTGPVEDVSGADIVTAGPLVGLRGVISAHTSAIRAQKPPTYSIKLRVTEEQQARVQMMEELLADEEKPKPLPTQAVITSRNIFRWIIAVILLLPMVWMVISGRRETSTPQPGNIPGVVDFTRRIQSLPSGAPVLIAFDYEAGFSGELNTAVINVISQLMSKNAFLTLVATSPSGPALAESTIKNASTNFTGNPVTYSSYTNLGYIPGGTMGLLALATSPKSALPYSLEGNNVWVGSPLNTISTIKDFSAVIVMTNDPDNARTWIEQVGPQLQVSGAPLLVVTSTQAEPLIRPYYEAKPSQVQGIIAGLAGGVAFARTIGNLPQNGVWDALSVGITLSVLIILVGSIAGVVRTMLPADKKED